MRNWKIEIAEVPTEFKAVSLHTALCRVGHDIERAYKKDNTRIKQNCYIKIEVRGWYNPFIISP